MAEIGTILDNIYEINREVGRGGMGAVYMATDTRLNGQWAVKEVVKIPGDKKSEFCVAGLRAEAELMKRFSHPHIPRIVSILDNPTELYVIMDFLRGQSLDVVLQERGPLPSSVVAQIGIQMCEALGYLHKQNPPVIYRDMKPSNVMLTNPDALPEDFRSFNRIEPKNQQEAAKNLSLNAMLFDFGIASEGEKASGLTPGYAPPEAFKKGERTGLTWDIYSLGVTMYQLVTGHDPVQERLFPITHWNEELNTRLSTGLERIILKCTSEKPEDRYQSCEELKRALEHYTELDDEVLIILRRTFRLFLIPAILAVVCLVGGIAGRMLYSQRNTTSYDTVLAMAEREPDHDTSQDYYVEAIGYSPYDIRAYKGLISLYKQDSVFDNDERAVLQRQIQPNLSEIRRQNVEDYVQLCYDVGALYWFYYDYGDTADNQTTRMVNALPWFTNVKDTCEEEQLEYARLNATNIFCDIATFYRDYANNLREAEDAGTYLEFWSTLVDLRLYLEEGNDQELMQWESYKVIVFALQNLMPKFRSDGVSKDDMQSMIDAVREDVSRLVATTDVTEKIRDGIQELIEEDGSIDRSVNAIYGS